ncbi:hypothetical protein B0H63DRAFT_486326 [Podospora didyma]|uniref:rRNA biogenesis protein RRP36 n=1 Tax=Podospora didyma TaxID=330526 RepID=A0AAE0K6E2_9PEZI|nr:hypothetical protein B0H63DRAFT_486326 [Podospora didyma]
MSSAQNKRKAPGGGLGLLQRRVRPRVEREPNSESDADSQAPSEEGVDSQGSGSDDEEDDEVDDSGSEEESGDEESEDEASPSVDASQLSFGALARAQAALGAASRRKGAAKEESITSKDGGAASKDESSYLQRQAEREEKKKKQLLKRASKHAPAEMTSKKAVSRRRDFVTVPTAQPRDPRFGPLVGAPVDEVKLRKAYSFLDDYLEDEMKQLREAIKKTGKKDPVAKEKLQRALMVMESKKKTQVRKDRERHVIEEHRRQEKELVAQGKQPFYLKKAEQKKRVLIDQFSGLKKGQVDHAIERKRKKVASKEKKLLPYARRTAE